MRIFAIMIKKNYRFNYLILIYLAGIVLFMLFRVAETMAYCAQTEGVDNFEGLYGHALWLGFRFDSAVSAYVLITPLVMMIIGEMARIRKRWYYAIIHYLTMVLYTVCFFACAADIPFFLYFSQRLNATVMTLGSSLPMVVDMIFSEPEYLFYLSIFVAVSIGWWFLGRLIYRKVLIRHLEEDSLNYGWSIPLAVMLLFGLFVGMRGHLTKERPLRPDHAVFCHNPFLNQIGLNPVFSFMKSAEAISKDKRNPLELIDIETARQQFEMQQAWPMVEGDAVALPKGTNVVIVLMESISVERTCLGSNPEASLTPCLDSLMHQGITFTQGWSAGIQSYNGIYSTHYGHPTIFKRHSLHIDRDMVPRVCGLPQILQANGYSTAYFMPHKGLFDGMEKFFYSNGYDHVFEENSYPKSELVSTYGVPDHILFHHAIEYMNQESAKGPTYITVATCSNHPPLVLPKNIDFKPQAEDLKEQMMEYADWSIGQFMAEAAKQPWFSNTLFVFVADHGCNYKESSYDIHLPHVRIPISFYAPGRIEPKFISRQACQIDVPPTILGMLGIDYNNHMLGIDILKQQRRYSVLGTWETIGAADGELLYIYRKDGRSTLHRYMDGNPEDVSAQYPDRKADLERYIKGIVQLSYQMLKDGTTRCNK